MKLEINATEARPERIRVRLPIRVIGSDEARGRFLEDTHTIVVSPTGSLIALLHHVFPGDFVRIINLRNIQEADFRVVGPSIVGESGVAEWGVECTEKGRNIWGVEFPPGYANDSPVLLECRACHRQDTWPTTVLEREVLEATGIITLTCAPCAKPTYWTYVEPSQRPPAFAQAEVVAPPPRVMPLRQFVERRAHKRLNIKLPVLIRTENGEEEITKTENLTTMGAAIALALQLEENQVVTILCPYTEGGQNMPQKAKVRWRDPYPAGAKRFYGFRYMI